MPADKTNEEVEMEAELNRRQALALATGALVGSGAVLGSLTEAADAATPTVRNGKLSNTVKVRAKGTFHGSRLKGEATLTVVDPAGKELRPPSRSQFTGTRIVVEAP
jgi:hypothetical protein